MDIGFIGLGIMGGPMALNLVKGGHALFVHDIGQLPAAIIEAGATACVSGRDAAERSEITITMVPDTPDVEAALFGADGVAEGLSPGKLVIDMSSISPTATQRFAERIAGLGL